MIVRVWNDNTYPYTEKFKGNEIKIDSQKYIEMDEDDAQLFLGQFTQIVKRGDGTPDPKCFKKLRIEWTEKPKYQRANPLMLHATGQIAQDVEELKQLTKLHSHALLKEDLSEGEAGKAAEIAELKSQLRELQEAMGQLLADKPRRKRKTEESETENPL